jgi:hypothetical protein
MALAVQPEGSMLHRLPASLGIALLIAVAGCSGAEESELFGAEAKGGASSSTDTPATSTDSTTPAPGSGGSSSTEEPAPPAPTPTDPGTAPAPGTPKPVCVAESVDNDEFKSADAFDACITGKLTARDVDYVSIIAPATAKQVFIKHSESGGKVAYKVFVNGFTATFTDTPPDDLPAVPSAKYTFKVENAFGTTGDRDWKLEVSFQ